MNSILLWERYDGELKRHIRSRVSDSFEAEDILQEVYIRAVRNEEKLMHMDEPRAWLHRVASNIIVDYYRRKARYSYVENLDEIDGERSRDPLLDNYNSETASCLIKLTELLPEKYKEAILESDLKGVQQNQLGTRWNLSHSGAKNRVQRARKKLRETMLDCCEVTSDHQGNIIELVSKEGSKEKFSCLNC